MAGELCGHFGTGGNAVIIMVSASKFVAVSLNDPNPAVLDFELSSAAAASVTLSSVSLNPASVTGGILLRAR